MTEVVDVNEGRGGARLCVLLKNHEVGTRPLFHITEGAKGSSNTYFHTTKVDTADRCFARGYVWATRRCGTVRVGGGEWGADEDDCGWALPAASAGGNGYTPPVFLREYRSAGRRDTAVAALASTEQSLLSLLGDSKSEYTLVSREMCAVEVSAHETLTQPLFRMVHAASSYDTRLATQKTRKELEADGYYCEGTEFHSFLEPGVGRTELLHYHNAEVQDSACAVKGSERANELVKAGYVLEHSLGYVYG